MAQPPAAAAPAFPPLRAVGQIRETYLIAEGPEGMYLIDQHAAHERVMYERILAARAARQPLSQGLLAPVALELSPAQAARVAEHRSTLAVFGFEVEAFGPGSGRAYLLRAAPPQLRADDPARAFVELVDLMTREDGPADAEGRVAASLACHAAVRAGKTLSLEEMRELVQQLERTAVPNTCPHGRPTLIQLSAETLAKEFGRR